ncbi:hypothetical protein [uncultured Shewanella sp.]|uniref:hypothetical protein n=1 Tax=uncultured Shewanella sp. TaxID=173975 RepID=UPI002612AFEC|nr:hypothetical protein [uncultured Shewanella sp.]
MKDPKHKTQVLYTSCKSCDRMITIEGEAVCYKEGSIVSLTQLLPSYQPNLLCHQWKLGKLTY